MTRIAITRNRSNVATLRIGRTCPHYLERSPWWERRKRIGTATAAAVGWPGITRARGALPARGLYLWFALPGNLDTAATHASVALTAVDHVPAVAPDASSLADLFGLAGADDEDAVQRRAFLMSLASVAGLGATEPGLGLEGTRHRLDRAIAGQRAATDVDEWHEIALEYGHTYRITAPRGLLKTLAVDLYGLQMAIERQPDDLAQRALRQAGAMLSSFTARTLGNLGYVSESRRWWRTARRAADESQDRYTMLWVRGREIVRAGYEQRPATSMLALINATEARIDDSAAVALPEFLSGKAQALALMGGPPSGDAEATLVRLREAFEALPPSVTTAHDSEYGYGEEHLRFTESLVYTYLGDYKRACAAQDRALALYPAHLLREPPQIELHRALCPVGAGDVTTGVRHAQTVITSLPPMHRVIAVADLGHKVLKAVPVTAHQQPDVAEYRECLTSTFAMPAPELTTRQETAALS